MHGSLLSAIAAVVGLGVGAQWLAWRFKLPSILLLLVFGFLAGPVTGLIDPVALQGDWLFPFVSLAVGIILFEGGLSLRLDELREVGKAVLNLVTIGVAITGVLAGLAAFYLLGFSPGMAVVIGSILTVTGPTVVIPLLRHVRPSGRVGTIGKWEGITVDPIGAIVAVLALETVLLLNEPVAVGGEEGLGTIVGHLFEGLVKEAVVGAGAGFLGFALILFLLRRRLVPDWLQNPISLMTVVLVFATANQLQDEAGLVATTLMGVMLANQRQVSVRKIIEFKEDLRVLLISTLFIVLSARLELSALDFIGPEWFVFLAVLMFAVRPLSVWASAAGTKLDWREIAFLSWLAPRGIVAASVAALFSFRLEEVYPLESQALVPLIFFVIVGTVAVYGLTISPFARWLGLAQPDPQGLVIVGAHEWARRIAQATQDAGFRTLLLDANPHNVATAERDGLEAERANVLAEGVVDELGLSGIGRMLALTPNDEVNALAALAFGEVFESAEVYQLTSREDDGSGDARLDLTGPMHLRGRPLFGKETTFAALNDRFRHGDQIASIPVREGHTPARLRSEYGPAVLPLFLIREKKLYLYSDGQPGATPIPGDLVLALVNAQERAAAEQAQERADVERAAAPPLPDRPAPLAPAEVPEPAAAIAPEPGSAPA